MMQLNKKTWLSIALVNLGIVALLGVLLRSKILFSIPFLDFKNTMHAHSHYAFGGWVTLALLALMTYEILPKKLNSKRIYNILFGCILLNAIGMLISFPIQGYAFYSILCSTLFIFTTYVFAWIFIKHIRHSTASNSVKILSVFALIYLVLSSAGPFTLAYLLATKSSNALIYKDAIYTYLHLQYNGFFTLAILALLFNRMENNFQERTRKYVLRFSQLLIFSVIPSMFLCYLWHYPGAGFKLLAFAGSLSMVASALAFIIIAYSSANAFKKFHAITRKIMLIAMVAFVLKMLLQALTIIPEIGAQVFTNRPVIIGFLHLVLLGFVTLYILAHYIEAGILKPGIATNTALTVFASGVIMNEIILFVQGMGIMLMFNSTIYSWALWVTGIWLFTGSVLMIIARFKQPALSVLSKELSINLKTANSFFNYK